MPLRSADWLVQRKGEFCAACRSGCAFTDASFPDIGTRHGDDIGLGRLIPSSVALRHAFETPTCTTPHGARPTCRARIGAEFGGRHRNRSTRGSLECPSRGRNIRPTELIADEKLKLSPFRNSGRKGEMQPKCPSSRADTRHAQCSLAWRQGSSGEP